MFGRSHSSVFGLRPDKMVLSKLLLTFGSTGVMGLYSKEKIKEKGLVTIWLRLSLALARTSAGRV